MMIHINVSSARCKQPPTVYAVVLTALQEPVVKIGTGVTAGFKGGFVQVKGLLNKAAEAVQEAAAATATSVGAIAAKQRSTGGGGEKE